MKLLNKHYLIFIGKILILFFISHPIQAQQRVSQIGGTCEQATLVESKLGFIVENTGNGEKGDQNNKPSCSGLPFNQSMFLKFVVTKTGTLNFLITPENDSSEYDWFLYKLTTCTREIDGDNNMRIPGEIVCNFACNLCSDPIDTRTGMSPDGQGNRQSPLPFFREITVNAGTTYLLQIDHYGEFDCKGCLPTDDPIEDRGFSISFGGTMEIDPTLNIIEEKKSHQGIFKVSPNPFVDQVTIQLTKSIHSNISYQLINDLGQVIETNTISKNQLLGRSSYTLDLRNKAVPTGLYFLILHSNDGNEVIKLQKN